MASGWRCTPPTPAQRKKQTLAAALALLTAGGVHWAAEPMSDCVKEVAHPETNPPGASSPRLASLAAGAQHLPKGPRLLRPPLAVRAPAAEGGRATPGQWETLRANPRGPANQCLPQTSPPTETGGPGWVADGRHLQLPKGKLENSSNSGSNLLRDDMPWQSVHASSVASVMSDSLTPRTVAHQAPLPRD